MSFFQRLRNGLSRFMYGRNGADQLGLCIIWTAIVLDLISMLVKKNGIISSIIGLVTTVMVLWALFRVFSRNLEKRRAEACCGRARSLAAYCIICRAGGIGAVKGVHHDQDRPLHPVGGFRQFAAGY